MIAGAVSRTGVGIALTDIVEPHAGGYFNEDFEEVALHNTGQALLPFLAEHAPAEISIRLHVMHGTIYDEILHAADKLGCDAVIVASLRPAL